MIVGSMHVVCSVDARWCASFAAFVVLGSICPSFCPSCPSCVLLSPRPLPAPPALAAPVLAVHRARVRLPGEQMYVCRTYRPSVHPKLGPSEQ